VLKKAEKLPNSSSLIHISEVRGNKERAKKAQQPTEVYDEDHSTPHFF
jgi:hypothetical protein